MRSQLCSLIIMPLSCGERSNCSTTTHSHQYVYFTASSAYKFALSSFTLCSYFPLWRMWLGEWNVVCATEVFNQTSLFNCIPWGFDNANPQCQSEANGFDSSCQYYKAGFLEISPSWTGGMVWSISYGKTISSIRHWWLGFCRARPPELDSNALCGNEWTIRALEEAGADVSTREECQKTPMHYVAGWGHVEAIMVLKEAGSNVSTREECQETPMHYAAMNGHVDAIRALKEAGTNVSAWNEQQWTPMHHVAKNGYVDAINALKEAGADVSWWDNKGKTLLNIARKYHAVNSVRFLKAVTVATNTRDTRSKNSKWHPWK